MKTPRSFVLTIAATLLLTVARAGAQTAPPRPAPVEPVAVPWHVSQREAHQNVWESVKLEQINPITGQKVARQHRYVELATGLNRLNQQGQYLPR